MRVTCESSESSCCCCCCWLAINMEHHVGNARCIHASGLPNCWLVAMECPCHFGDASMLQMLHARTQLNHDQNKLLCTAGCGWHAPETWNGCCHSKHTYSRSSSFLLLMQFPATVTHAAYPGCLQPEHNKHQTNPPKRCHVDYCCRITNDRRSNQTHSLAKAGPAVASPPNHIAPRPASHTRL
jgi:hypothetical protein